MNNAQKVILSIFIPLIAMAIGFELIGSSGSLQRWGIAMEKGYLFNPIRYFSLHGYQWTAVLVVTVLIELFIWKSPKSPTPKDK